MEVGRVTAVDGLCGREVQSWGAEGCGVVTVMASCEGVSWRVTFVGQVAGEVTKGNR